MLLEVSAFLCLKRQKNEISKYPTNARAGVGPLGVLPRGSFQYRSIEELQLFADNIWNSSPTSCETAIQDRGESRES